MWPASKLLGAELRVNGSAALVLHDAAANAAAANAAAAAAPRSHAGGAAARTPRLATSEVAGLCSVTILSLPAHATLTVAVQHATARTRAYIGLRKL